MNKLIASLNTAWLARNRRERNLIAVAAVVLTIALLWSLHDGVRRERARLDRVLPVANAQLKAMQEQAAELARLGNLPRLQKTDSTRQTEDIQTAAKLSNVSVQVRPEGGKLTLTGEAPQFNVLVSFIANLQASLGMRSEMLDITRSGSNVRFELRLAPAN